MCFKKLLGVTQSLAHTPGIQPGAADKPKTSGSPAGPASGSLGDGLLWDFSVLTSGESSASLMGAQHPWVQQWAGSTVQAGVSHQGCHSSDQHSAWYFLVFYVVKIKPCPPSTVLPGGWALSPGLNRW